MVETVLPLKSTLEASSEIVLMDDDLYHSCGRSSIFDLSAMRAFESLVRSIGRFGSLEMIVMAPLNPCSRSACTAPIAPLPLQTVSS